MRTSDAQVFSGLSLDPSPIICPSAAPALKGTPRSAAPGPGWGLGQPRGRAGVLVVRGHTHIPAYFDELSPPQTNASMTSEHVVSMDGEGADGSQRASACCSPTWHCRHAIVTPLRASQVPPLPPSHCLHLRLRPRCHPAAPVSRTPLRARNLSQCGPALLPGHLLMELLLDC